MRYKSLHDTSEPPRVSSSFFEGMKNGLAIEAVAVLIALVILRRWGVI
jgi:hypothetical protein